MTTEPVCVFEHELLASQPKAEHKGIGEAAYKWLLDKALCAEDDRAKRWVVATKGGVKFKNHVGVIRTPDGTQIEVLPKVGKAAKTDGEEDRNRQLLVEMLCCLQSFRHVNAGAAILDVKRMPLLEVFIAQFLGAVAHAVKRGLRSHYQLQQDNLFALRGKLLISQQIRHNLVRPDRFFTEHDEFTPQRPENRLMRLALDCVMKVTQTTANQRQARELLFAFADIPASVVPATDWQRVRLDRGMDHYASAMDWTRWVLNHLAPVPASGNADAPALLYPMETLFEAFVAKHLRKQLKPGADVRLRQQVHSEYLVKHEGEDWFNLKPDLLVTGAEDRDGKCVLDTKWKLLDQNDRSKKFGIGQGDLYQLQAHGLSYLGSGNDVVLIYPKTEQFDKPLPVFMFNRTQQAEIEAMHITLWVLPFCLTDRVLLLPEEKCGLHELFESNTDTASVQAKAA